MSTRKQTRELSEQGRAKARSKWDDNEDEILQDLLDLTKAVKEGQYGVCPRCKTNIVLRIPDGLSRINAARTLREMGYGKIPQESPQAGGLVVHRTVIAPGGYDNGADVPPVVA